MIASRFPPTAIAIYHLPTTAGQKQPYPGTPDATVLAQFMPLDEKRIIMQGGEVLTDYEAYFDTSVDIRMGDQCVANGLTYHVRKVAPFTLGRLAYKRASLSANV
jgi:hypothetical protein